MVNLKKTVAMMTPIGLVASIALPTQGVADEINIVNDSAVNTVVDSQGNCVLAVGGRSATPPNCGLMAPEGDADGDGVVDSKDKCPGTEPGVVVDMNGCPKDSDGDGVPDYRDNCPNTPKGAKVDKFGCEIVGNITINLVNDEFDFDSAMLKPDMKAALDDLAGKVNANPGDEFLTIVGHTDSVGTDAYNQGLSERRAQSVANYLAGKGVNASKMATAGKGESMPVASNDNAAGRAKNRRVEISTK